MPSTTQVRVPIPLAAGGHKLYVAFFDPTEARQLKPNESVSNLEIDVVPVIGWMIDAASAIYAPDPLTPIGLITAEDLHWVVNEDPAEARAMAIRAADKQREKQVSTSDPEVS